jgi:hypothetical protein
MTSLFVLDNNTFDDKKTGNRAGVKRKAAPEGAA